MRIIVPDYSVYSTWQEWAGALSQQLREWSSQDEPREEYMVLSSGLTTAISAVGFTDIGWDTQQKVSKLYKHSTSSSPQDITARNPAHLVVEADLGFTGAGAFNVEAKLFLGGAEYGTHSRSRGEGVAYLQLSMIGMHVRVGQNSVMKIAAQASVAGVAMAAGRCRLVMRRIG